jgi:hypothetical protein
MSVVIGQKSKVKSQKSKVKKIATAQDNKQNCAFIPYSNYYSTVTFTPSE